MQLLAIRIHTEDREAVLEMFRSVSTEYFVVKEVDATRAHIQGIVDGSQAAWRKLVKRKFSWIKGNKDYSVAQVKKPDEYRRYLCKGAGPKDLPDVVCRHGLLYTDEWIAEQHAAYWVLHEKLPVGKKSKMQSVVDVMLEFSQMLGDEPDEVKERRVADRLIGLHVDLRKPIDMYYCQKVYNLAMAKYSQGYSRALQDSLIGKFRNAWS